MFEASHNDNFHVEISGMCTKKTELNMNSDRTNISNCPSVLTGMSHEMRTHMNAIVAFSFLMKDGNCSNSEREEYSNQIFSSCDQLLGLFDTFFDSAIIDNGNSKSVSQSYKLDSLLDDLIPEFREIIKKENQTGLELITDIQFNNSKDVFIDKDRVFRVIRSLFNNSIKNTISGYIRIGYTLKEELLTFYVLDSGQGYSKCKEFLHSEDLNSSLSKYNDTYAAMNITLAKKLIHLLGGNIWIENNGLTGSGLYFSIPVKMAITSDAIKKKYINTTMTI